MVRVQFTAEGGPELQVVAGALRAGAVAVVPSDTLYGFSARYDRPTAIRRIAAIKGRSKAGPFLVLVASREELGLLTESPPPPAAVDLLWPGPVTVVLPARTELSPQLRGPSGTVAVRWPGGRLIQELIAQVGVPIVSTSVNRHGEPPLDHPDLIERAFGSAIDLLADAGPREKALPSTIVDLTRRPPALLREGAAAVDLAELDRLLRLAEGAKGASGLP